MNMKTRLSTTEPPEDTRILIRYLLGDLVEEEQDEIEQRYSSDDNFYFKLLATEDELIDSYVLGEISQSDRGKFEQAYLKNPHRLKKVESNKIWLASVAKQLAPVPWGQRLGESLKRAFAVPRVSLNYRFAGAVLIAVLFGSLGWLLWDRMRLRGQLAQINSEWNQKANEYERQIAALRQGEINSRPTPSPLPTSPTSPGVQAGTNPEKHAPKVQSLSSFVAYIFPRVNARSPSGESEGSKPLVIRHGADLVRLTVDIEPNTYAEYKISLQKIGEPAFWDRSLSKNQPGFSSNRIVINLPADLFETEDYIFKVTAFDPSGEQILAFRHLTVINQNLARTNSKSAP
jgi:hypothetical protein